MSHSYKGDISVEDCWSSLESGEDAFLIDVRTRAEWNFVGLPAVPEGARAPILAEWQSFPTMAIADEFAPQLAQAIETAGGSTQSKLYFLCRSGARSMSTADAMTAEGFENCFNISDGFEGPPDREGHRGAVSGWKAAGLPWRQK